MGSDKLSSNNPTATIKVGLLTFISIALLVFCLIWLRGRGISPGTSMSVLFSDVDGMREGAAVQMMGIRVGFVDEIQAINKNGKYYVKVNFNINEDSNVQIPKGSRISIEQSGIIGEKFLEITPPQLQEVALSTFEESARTIHKGIPVRFLYEEGYKDVGAVEKVEKSEDNNLVRLKLLYRITLPGAVMPENPLFELTMDNGKYFLLIVPREPYLTKAPDPNLIFTVENPLRIKRFLEIQMESAEALKVTNDKINELLSDDAIDTINSTLKNTEVLTARATEVMDSANKLFQTTGRDLERLVSTSQSLAVNVTKVSDNINDVIGDPQLKQDVIATVHSIEQSTEALNSLVNDPAIKETLSMTRETSKNANELMAYLKATATDKELQVRLETSLNLLNTSLTKLSSVLDNVEEVTGDDDESLKALVKDARDTAKNLKSLSGKFSGRFTLFKLLF